MRYVFPLERYIYDYIADNYHEIERRYELTSVPEEIVTIFKDYYMTCCELAVNWCSMADMYETACSYVGEWSAEEDYLLAEKLRRMDPSHPFIRDLEAIVDSLHGTEGGVDLEFVLPDLFCHMLNQTAMREIQRVVYATLDLPENTIRQSVELNLNSRAVIVRTETPLRH